MDVVDNFKFSSYIAYRKGTEFFKAAELLDQQDDLLSAVAVNSMLACELMIKAILIMERQTSIPFKGHSLEKIFVELSESAQSHIKNNADIILWEQFMCEADSAFVDWRYIHEKRGHLTFGISDALSFFTAAKKYYELTYTDGKEYA